MDRKPFLLQFAEPVVALPMPALMYDPITRRNRLAETGNASVGWEGTVVTMTSETKDHVENDRILNEAGQPHARPDTWRCRVRCDDWHEENRLGRASGSYRRRPLSRYARGGREVPERLFGMLGTKKTDSHEQVYPADGDRSVRRGEAKWKRRPRSPAGAATMETSAARPRCPGCHAAGGRVRRPRDRAIGTSGRPVHALIASGCCPTSP